jgi:hypothetical protein
MHPNDPTAPPRDFSADHALLTQAWGYPPRVTPWVPPHERSMPTPMAPVGSDTGEHSIDLLRRSSARTEV